MSEAFLMNHGGVRFRALTVPVYPTKLEYLTFLDYHEAINMAGARVVANVGGDLITLTDDNYTVTLDIPNSKLTVGATIGGVGRTVDIPVTLVHPDPILNNNSWDIISRVASTGHADQIWAVGDTKAETIGDSSRTFRVIGYNHDDLASADSRYADKTYNQDTYNEQLGRRYAGMTFELAVTWWNHDSMNSSDRNNGGWDTCYMRNTVMQNVYDSFPDDMKAVIRTVNKRTSAGGYNTAEHTQVVTSADKVFLLAVYELTGQRYETAVDECAVLEEYAWYAGGNPPYKNTHTASYEWTRSPHDPNVCSAHSHFMTVYPNETLVYETAASKSYRYYPAFCV